MDSEKRLLQTENASVSLASVRMLDGMRILIVDERFVRKALFTCVLEKHGAKVITATSTAEALEAIEQLQPHLLISDISLSSEDGYNLIHKVRSLKANQGGRIPAIAITKAYREINYLNASPTEFQLHLTKPVDVDELVTAAVIFTTACP